MGAPNDPTKHHYIPEFLLRYWTGDDHRLERFDRPIPSKIMVRRVFPSEVGFEKDLYASPGHRLGGQWLELSVFQAIDNHAAPVLEKLNAGEIGDLSDQERVAWTLFMRSLTHRTPHYLRSTLASGIAHYRQILDELRPDYLAERDDRDPASYDEFRSRVTDQDMLHQAQRMLPDVMLNPRIGAFLINLPTIVIELPQDVPDFLISDDILIRTNGIQTPNGHIAMVISPRRLYLSAPEERTLREISNLPAKTLVRQVNQWTVESARYFVGARDRAQERFIRNRFGADPKPPVLRPELMTPEPAA
ncbi:DUF4238 domain-containing protein [Caulobacter endophyticus]|uniref:DUF4238 domain-containing protein n=1 Tax=Caulobacter endophyticus TaxID=2172652 RepID=A0A2T9JED9_9CAUL|nr:DUF4238 domain-containing protein [Caulobacter endophyticus]PVM82063.1 hypothetical protein DDF67_23925 [Caulobacter endophyticus]